MLEPEVKPSPAREIAHKGKGCLAVILALAVLLFGGYFVWDRASTFLAGIGEVPDYAGSGKSAVTVTIPEGASLDDIGAVLIKADVIKSTKAWDAAVQAEPRATSIQPGRYLMRTQIPAVDALNLLINPGESRIRSQFTIQEGLRLSAQVKALVKGTKIKKSAYDKALAKPKSLGLPAYAKNRPEGFLFPDTYELTADATATSTMKQMVTQYNAVTKDIGLVADAKKIKRSPYEVLIVASIIEREVNQKQDRAKVAQVLYNRLDAGMKLGLDSTVIYAENLKTNTTTPQDQASKSPYNTYRYKGLPPGPISAPGKAALEAAANPEKGDWLFFVTVNFKTGETKFATDEAGFLKLKAEFQQYCRDNPGTCDS
ncbi:endolytic transglycosylase MltG [uncultured Friedmanniella sp.]|uniref:endolytic transglycosylase MltG n=1 Tax=uncultured Friedmanniella sp. TaxID=335381 RepID=UPI0035CB0709